MSPTVLRPTAIGSLVFSHEGLYEPPAVLDRRRNRLEQGHAERELLLEHGLAATLLDELSAAIDQFDASVAETSNGTLSHVVARAELEELSD